MVDDCWQSFHFSSYVIFPGFWLLLIVVKLLDLALIGRLTYFKFRSYAAELRTAGELGFLQKCIIKIIFSIRSVGSNFCLVGSLLRFVFPAFAFCPSKSFCHCVFSPWLQLLRFVSWTTRHGPLIFPRSSWMWTFRAIMWLLSPGSALSHVVPGSPWFCAASIWSLNLLLSTNRPCRQRITALLTVCSPSQMFQPTRLCWRPAVV